MTDMQIGKYNGKEYAVMRLRSVAEVWGIVPSGSGTKYMIFPVLEYEETPNGELVPLLSVNMAEDKLKTTVIKGGSL